MDDREHRACVAALNLHSALHANTPSRRYHADHPGFVGSASRISDGRPLEHSHFYAKEYMTLIAAADGSALGNPGAAGWAWYIDEERWKSGGWTHATNNQAELMAVLSLLRETRAETTSLHVLCDSQYVINALTKWLPGWKRRGWRKADGKAVLNRDLLEQLDEELRGRKVSFEWVKGHSGHPLNEKVDELAKRAAMAFQRGGVHDEGPGLDPTAESPASPALPRSAEVPTLFDLLEEPSHTRLPHTESSSVQDMILRGERILHTARDVESISPLISDDSIVVTSDGTFTQGTSPKDGRMLRQPSPGHIDLLHFRELSPDTVVIVFRTESPSVCTSLWQRINTEWQRVLHQESR